MERLQSHGSSSTSLPSTTTASLASSFAAKLKPSKPPARASASSPAHASPPPPPAPAPAAPSSGDLLSLNLDLLLGLYSPTQLARILHRVHPDLLSGHDLAAWSAFFVGLGMQKTELASVLMYSQDAILENTPYTAGNAILFLRSLGITPEVLSRVIPFYPGLLRLSCEQLTVMTEQLGTPGLLEGPDAARRLLQLVPSYLLPNVHGELSVILGRIRTSREGKYSRSGSYMI